MQSVNNDMDDLFRQAAENYPLNTQGADWNKVLQGMESGRRKPMPQTVRNLERFFWVAAIFLVVVCTTFIQKKEYITQPGGRSSNAAENNSIEATTQGEEQASTPKAHTLPTRTQSPFLTLPKETSNEIPAHLEIGTRSQEIEEQPTEIAGEKITKESEQTTPVDSTQLLLKDKEQTIKEPGEIVKSDRKGSTGRIYAGFMAGPDVSTIKSQKMSNPGYSVGLLVGYQFHKRLSLETGVLWDRKDYYSTGKHFNKEKLGIPQHARVIDVDGYCNMFEIPVNIKFNWAQKSNYNLFATAGVSSYLMKREEYDYSYDYYGTQYKYYKRYNNASRNWTSILNLSIGFEKKMGNAGSLRIEPYMKLPLRGVGVGDLPIGSKGVFVGFTRPLR